MKASGKESSQQQERFANYLDQLGQAAGHADRVVPLQNYTKGLLLPIQRKSVEPMAARLAPGNVRQMHQSLHHIVAEAAWSDAALLSEVRRQLRLRGGNLFLLAHSAQAPRQNRGNMLCAEHETHHRAKRWCAANSHHKESRN
jgi:hypothetical protein